jgi:Na+/H+-translocating membrane pyrophosphatase
MAITASGIIVSFLVSFLALHLPVRKDNIETTLKVQIVVSTVVMIPVM